MKIKKEKIFKIILVILTFLLAASTVLLFVPPSAFKKPKKTTVPKEFQPPSGKPKIKGPSAPPPQE